MTPTSRPVAIIACRVLQSIIQAQIKESDTRIAFLDYGLHRTPQLMAQAIQEQIDALPEPHLVCLGYGLCGNGLAGLKARNHTLVIPRTDDCIAMFLGSCEAYRKEFDAEPGTYYLTRGWLESGSEPLSEYRECLKKYGAEDAGWIMDSQYRDYRRLCFVAFSDEDLAAYRNRAIEVADFCRGRWGWRYEERLGSDDLVRRFVAFSRNGAPESGGDDFVIVAAGEEVRQDQFLR